MFTDDDLIQLQGKGISEAQVQQQMSYFRDGFPYLKLIRAACVGDGMLHLSGEQADDYINFYESNLEGNAVVKFVPASGAASRMFKEFFALMQDSTATKNFPKAVDALNRIEDFAFFEQIKSLLAKKGLDLNQMIDEGDYQQVLQHILTDKGLNYGFLPKGMLAFHKYQSGVRVPVEEHLVEAAHYGSSGDGTARLHFTVSPQHRSNFDALESQRKSSYEQIFNVSFHISYSEQKSSTDTIAVDLENQPFRNEDGSLLFRPGGHGALLENLNEIEGDIIFIKNIDNVVPDHLKDQTYRYKKALAGLLLKIRADIFRLLKRLDEHQESAIEEASTYLKKQLFVQPSSEQEITWSYVQNKLNRPLRICGVVKNQGEPGGGPFWAQSADGTSSLQIVETSQVDPGDDSQQGIVRNATHFSPVDLVCSIRDYQGNKFNLLNYRDLNTGFISQKSKDGRDLKALELPGLWNGSMADWNTIFVEVPAITFNPVKTVYDLLRKEHQPKARMFNYWTFLLTLFCLLPACLLGQPGLAFLLKPDRVFDGHEMHKGWAVLTEGDRILAAGPVDQLESSEQVVHMELRGMTLLPGMIEGHGHLFLYPYNQTGWNDQVLKESQALRVARATVHAKETLLAGFTTFRDLGTEGAGYADVGLKQAIQQGIIPGPRLIISTKAIVATGSYGPKGFATDHDLPVAAEVADGYENLIQVVRNQIGKGADFIKVYADYRWGPGGEAKPTFTLEELKLMVSIANSSGRPVVAHAASKEGMMRAILAGVQTIEHGDGGNVEVFKLMATNGIALCPTLAAGEAIAQYQGWQKGSEDEPDRVKNKRSSFKMALENHVKICAGGDVGVFAHGDNVRELELMVEYGMSNAAVLTAVTSGNAEILNLSHQLGSIAPGLQADLIAVKGNPMDDISDLRNVTLVMKAGKIYQQK